MIGKYAYNENTEQLVGKITGEDASHWLVLDNANIPRRIHKQIAIVQDSDGALIQKVDLNQKYANPEATQTKTKPENQGILCESCYAMNPADSTSCNYCHVPFGSSDKTIESDSRMQKELTANYDYENAEQRDALHTPKEVIQTSNRDRIFTKNGKRVRLPGGLAWPVLAAGLAALFFYPLGFLGTSFYCFTLGDKKRAVLLLVSLVGISTPFMIGGPGPGQSGAFILVNIFTAVVIAITSFALHRLVEKDLRKGGWAEIFDENLGRE